MIEPPSDDTARTLATVSSTLLAMLRVLSRIEERLLDLESAIGVAPGEYNDDDRDEGSQSVQRREWDAVGQRWVYVPEPE